MNQVQVDVIEPETPQGLLEGRGRALLSLIIVPQLGGHEELVTGDVPGGDGLADGTPDGLLVPVERGSVDVSVSGRDGLADHAHRLIVAELPGAQSDLWHLSSVVERQGGDSR